MPETLLALEGVSLAAPDGRMIFEELHWRLEEGARFHLLGGLGNGATALLRLCAGLAAPLRGRVLLGGLPLAPDTLDHPFISRGDLGWVPTDGGLAANLTLLQNVALPLRFARKVGKEEALAEAARWLDRAGLSSLADTRPRVPPDRACWLASLARAGAKKSRLWLVDRPAGGLDPASLRAARGMLEGEPGAARVMVGGEWMAALGQELRIEDGRLAPGSPA